MSAEIGLLVLAVLAVPVLLLVALALIAGLRRRVADLETQVADLARQRIAAPATAEEPTLGDWMRESAPAAPVRSSPVADTGAVETPASPAAPPTPIDARAATQDAPPIRPSAHAGASASAAPPPLPPRAPAPPRQPPPPGAVDIAVRAARRWFTEGNVPVKVGVLVLFAGVAALLKYASDQGWMTFPIELRLAGIALAALAGLVFGWRQREARRPFALALQGGAIGVLLMVVFAAFKLYPLLDPLPAFALTVALIAGLGVLAVLQNALALAVFGLLAGFLAPVWLSTGSGNHVALFGYYAVLNAAIFAIAWWRAWRVLNVMGFVFTFGIGTLWGVLKYRPQDFATTEPFLLLFFAFYLLIPILYAWRRGAGRRDLLDGCLLFGTPLVAFSLQAGLLRGDALALAYCALALAVIYAALAWWLRRRERFAALVAPYAVLAVGFATLAVPLALSAHATAAVFALEGAGLAWLGLRQRRLSQQLAGALLQVGGAIAFVIGLIDAPRAAQAVANAPFMGALLVAVAGFASAWSYRRGGEATPALAYYLWALAWWLGNGGSEIVRFVAVDARADALLAFAIASGWLAAETDRRLPARALAWTVVAALAAALPLAWLQDGAHAQPFGGGGGFSGATAWLAYALLGARALHRLRERDDATPALAQLAWIGAWLLAFALALHEAARTAGLAQGWQFAAAALPVLAAAALARWRPQWLAWPTNARFDTWRAPLRLVLALLLALFVLSGLFLAGASAPLPWVSVLNPLELAQLAALAWIARWLASDDAPVDLRARRVPLLAVAGFAWITVATLRACHHWGGVPWDAGPFESTMLLSNLVQTALTVVWSVLGVLGWIVGSRRGLRGLWLAGAVLMAVVLVKLVLVDRQHLGNLLGIASFMAYGLLCAAVGYFAPQPPRAATPHSPSPEPAR